MTLRTISIAFGLVEAAGLAARAEEPPLKTGVDGTFAPHAMPKLSGGIEGFNVDLANEIGRRLKRKVEIDATQFSGLLPGLAAGT
jgi:polar amino acid transport system substrate-binding protein